MASSKKTTKKTETKTASEKPVESVAVAQPLGSPLSTKGTQGQTKRKPVAPRRVPVQYTPRIPTAHCPGC